MLLTLELLPILLDSVSASDDGRIVFLSSRAHSGGSWNPATMNPQSEAQYERMKTYGNTKMYNVRSCHNYSPYHNYYSYIKVLKLAINFGEFFNDHQNLILMCAYDAEHLKLKLILKQEPFRLVLSVQSSLALLCRL